MSVVTGPFVAVSLLLAVGGVAKLRHPGSAAAALTASRLPGSPLVARALGAAELLVGVAAVAVGGPVTAALVALAYVGFAGFVAVALRSGRTSSCGCFGAESPATPLHLGLDVAAAAVAAAAVVRPADGLAVFADHPGTAVPFVALTLLATWFSYLALAALAPLSSASGGRP